MKKWWMALLAVVTVLAIGLGAGWVVRALAGNPVAVGTEGKVKAEELLTLRREKPIQFQGQDISAKDFSGVTTADLFAMTWDTRTKWPGKAALPAGFDPVQALETGKDPGLGIRDLHKRGITGKGIAVAVIDFPMDPGHKEFDPSILYNEVAPNHPNAKRTHFHGAATASIVAGKTVGVAPGVKLHYYAVPDSGEDQYFELVAKAIYEVIDVNTRLPEADRIRVISISTGWNKPVFVEAIKKAEETGIAVVHCGEWLPSAMDGTGAPPDRDRSRPDSYEPWLYFALNSPGFKGRLPVAAPSDYRTTASVDGKDVYVYWGQGGRSWSCPYVAGVVALGMQANPKLTAAEAYQALNATVTKNKQGIPVINPQAFIAQVSQR